MQITSPPSKSIPLATSLAHPCSSLCFYKAEGPASYIESQWIGKVGLTKPTKSIAQNSCSMRVSFVTCVNSIQVVKTHLKLRLIKWLISQIMTYELFAMTWDYLVFHVPKPTLFVGSRPVANKHLILQLTISRICDYMTAWHVVKLHKYTTSVNEDVLVGYVILWTHMRYTG